MSTAVIETERTSLLSSLSPPAGDPGFLKEVVEATVGVSHLERCIQCGTCGGSCPSAADMDHTPRQLFAMIRAGLRDEVLRSNTPWFCVSCYTCVVRCPQEVHITDVIYTLKSMAIRAGYYKDAAAPDFAKTFVYYVENYGRSFELGLATRFYLRHHPLRVPGIAPLGLDMLMKGRIDLTPRRIKHIDQLKTILARAAELEAQQ